MLKTIIERRGFCKVANEYMPIKSNAIVEEQLGDKGLICVDDVVGQLIKGGEHFEDALQFVG
jgi:large subunit ribosomal protein L7e